MSHSFIIHKQLIGLDQSVGHTAEIVLTQFVSTDKGKWLSDRDIQIETLLDDAPEQFGMWLILYANMSDEDRMMYKLSFEQEYKTKND